MTNERLLDKLAKIQAHAESAEKIGNEAEAEAFAQMLQRLCLKHKIAMNDIQFQELDKEEPIGRHNIGYAAAGLETKAARIRWQEQLAGIVARAHFCRILVTSGDSRVTLVGRQSDCAVADYMFTTLARAIIKLAKVEHGKFYRECHRENRLEDARGFKTSFIDAFVTRLRQRFVEEKKVAKAESSNALVRINTEEKAIDDHMEANYGGHAKALSRNKAFNTDGANAGRAAANGINLKGNAIPAGRTSQRQLR